MISKFNFKFSLIFCSIFYFHLSSIAPIARYAIFWGLPVVTVNAMAGDFRKKKKIEYKTLTNIGPSNYWQETFVKRIFEKFGWKKTIMLFDKDYQEKETNSNCFLTMSSLKSALLDNKISVDYKIKEKQDTREYDDLLREYVQNKFRFDLKKKISDFK